MKSCILLVAIMVGCEAVRLSRVAQQQYFPNFQHIYQHGQANNHDGLSFLGNYKPQDGNVGLGAEYYGRQAPIDGQANFANHLAGVPFGENVPNNGGFRAQDTVSQGYERFNHAYNYDYQV